jgi:hypothetical protein
MSESPDRDRGCLSSIVTQNTLTGLSNTKRRDDDTFLDGVYETPFLKSSALEPLVTYCTSSNHCGCCLPLESPADRVTMHFTGVSAFFVMALGVLVQAQCPAGQYQCAHCNWEDLSDGNQAWLCRDIVS